MLISSLFLCAQAETCGRDVLDKQWSRGCGTRDVYEQTYEKRHAKKSVHVTTLHDNLIGALRKAFHADKEDDKCSDKTQQGKVSPSHLADTTSEIILHKQETRLVQQNATESISGTTLRDRYVDKLVFNAILKWHHTAPCPCA